MALIEEQENELKTMRVGAFPGGMNTSAPINEILDTELVQARNFEYDDQGNLIARNGVIGAEGVVGVWDETLWDASLWDNQGTLYDSPITSILDFEGASAFVGILYTVDTRLLSRTLAGVITNLTGSLVLPDGVRWYWEIFNGVAVGVNGLTSGHNPVQVVAPAPGTASHLSTAPPGKHIAVHENRLWIARSDQPNQIQASDIGSHSSWNTDTGANPAHGAKWDLDKDDGDFIVALYSDKERLFVFKNNSIHVGEGNPERPNDLRFFKFREYASEVGCISPTTIRPVLDDVFFRSKGGIGSLSAAQIVADFESHIVSTKMANIQDISQDAPDEDIFAFVIRDRSQYCLAVSRGVSATSENIVYVFDYRDLKKGIVRWVEFDGLAYFSAAEVYDHDVEKLIYLFGCHNIETDKYFIGQYIPKAKNKTFIDSSLAIRYFLLTKGYDFDVEDIRKYLSRWFSKIKSLTENASLSVSYFLDEENAVVGNYTFNLGIEISGTLFDVPTSLFDSDDVFDQGSVRDVEFIRRAFIFDKPRKARIVQFQFLCNQANQAIGILSFGIKYKFLDEYRAQTI